MYTYNTKKNKKDIFSPQTDLKGDLEVRPRLESPSTAIRPTHNSITNAYWRTVITVACRQCYYFLRHLFVCYHGAD